MRKRAPSPWIDYSERSEWVWPVESQTQEQAEELGRIVGRNWGVPLQVREGTNPGWYGIVSHERPISPFPEEEEPALRRLTALLGNHGNAYIELYEALRAVLHDPKRLRFGEARMLSSIFNGGVRQRIRLSSAPFWATRSKSAQESSS
ncbi:MAG: hypothetical protein H0U76_21950 [Ktedonobacteraceae bacterium]|nr:hypothetical protein [Ktedonobacteraceae bacterium]